MCHLRLLPCALQCVRGEGRRPCLAETSSPCCCCNNTLANKHSHTHNKKAHAHTKTNKKTKQQNKAVTSFASPLRPGCTFVSSLPVAPFVSPDPSWRTSERTKQEKPHTHTCTEGVFDREQQGNEKNSSKHKRSSAHTHTHNHSQHIQNHARTFLG